MKAYAIHYGVGKVWTAYTDASGTEQVTKEDFCKRKVELTVIERQEI